MKTVYPNKTGPLAGNSPESHRHSCGRTISPNPAVVEQAMEKYIASSSASNAPSKLNATAHIHIATLNARNQRAQDRGLQARRFCHPKGQNYWPFGVYRPDRFLWNEARGSGSSPR